MNQNIYNNCPPHFFVTMLQCDFSPLQKIYIFKMSKMSLWRETNKLIAPHLQIAVDCIHQTTQPWYKQTNKNKLTFKKRDELSRNLDISNIYRTGGVLQIMFRLMKIWRHRLKDQNQIIQMQFAIIKPKCISTRTNVYAYSLMGVRVYVQGYGSDVIIPPHVHFASGSPTPSSH